MEFYWLIFGRNFKSNFKRVATENSVRQRSKDIYKSLNVINQEIQARDHKTNSKALINLEKCFFRCRCETRIVPVVG